MKKIISQLALFVAFTILLISCGKNENKSGSGIQTEKLKSVAVGNEKFSLRYKFEKGEKFSYKLSTEVTNNETVKADSVAKSNVKQNLNYIFECEVIDVDNDKVAEINIKVTEIKLDATYNGQKITYHSGDKKLTQQDKLKFLEYETIFDTPFRARVSSKGEVIEVSRLEKMVEKMNSMSPQKQNLTAEQKSAYAKQLGESALKPMMQMVFREQPEQTIMKDSTWEKRVPQQLGTLTMENIARFKVIDFVDVDGEKAAKISASLSASFSGKNEGTENGITYNFGKPEINGDGMIYFNVDAGKLIKADTGTKSLLTVTMTGKNSVQKVQKTVRTTSSNNRTIIELL